jgi:acyl-CoA thioesterase
LNPEPIRLTALLSRLERSGPGVALAVPDDWMQGRSVFGGLQAAIGVAAMRTQVPATLPLRTLQVGFIAPVPAGEVRAAARILRQGKSAIQVEARLFDGDETLATMLGIFGAARPSRVAHRPTKPEVPAQHNQPFPYLEGVVPAFTRQFTANWRNGGLPFTGSDSRQTVVDLALQDSGPCTEAHVLALADFIPPVALSLLDTPSPGSSLTWMLELFGDAYASLPLAGWRVDSEMLAAQDGYTSQSNRLWAPDEGLVAISQQSMVVFG